MAILVHTRPQAVGVCKRAKLEKEKENFNMRLGENACNK